LALVVVAGAAAPAHAQDDAAAAATAYAAIRIVKETAGEPSTPQITLPTGYTFVSGSAYRWASRGEYYAFVQGPQSSSVQISVSWPQTPIAAIVSDETRVPFTRDPDNPDGVTFRIPVTGTSATGVRNTIEVFSYISGSTASGVYWRVEHNHPDRAAGVWTTVPWPATQSRAFLNFLVASEAILQDSGLAAEARRRGHFFALMGFETNNLTHLDNPPHWHQSYYPGVNFGAPRAHVPHFWMDARGRVFYNGMDIQGQGRSRFYAGDPAPSTTSRAI
jgi:hypothetical protein